MSRSAISFVLLLALWPAETAGQINPHSREYGQYAPEDAYLEGSPYPYYGSENQWSRRMFSELAAERFYKRRGQRQLLAILDGHPQEAVALCQKRLKDDPDDAESWFVLTVAWCQLDELEKALAAMKRALTVGLPLERFLAGPRELLKPLTGSAAFRTVAAKVPGQLLHGPMVGALTDHSACFWVRTLKEAPVTVKVFPAGESEKPPQVTTVVTRAERDYTAVAKITGLQAATRYAYDVLINNESALGPDYPAFRTFPATGTPARFQVGFGGGAGYTPEHERMWDTIAAQQLAAFLFLGDNVYIDLPEMPGPFHDYTYYRRQSRPEFRRLVRSIPVFAIWDDHDCAIDDVWMGPYRDKPVWKQPMLALFRNNWNNPAYGDRQWPGCWLQFSIGQVDFFLLDCRFYRSNPFAGQPTMLGPHQKAWLFEQLKGSQGVFKVLVSSVPWAEGAKPESRDTWDGFPGEREEIFSFIEQENIEGVILLSADRHRSDAWKIPRPKSYALYDLMSSRLTNMHTHELMPGSLFGYNEKCSFGLLTFDTVQPDPEILYQIVSIDGEIVHSLPIKKSSLSYH